MVKRFLTLTLCALILSCLAACGKTDETNNTNSQSEKNELATNSAQETKNLTGSVFVTENITRITFYGYYGSGTGSDVPSEHMAEITDWLASFTIDKKVEDALDGVNTHQVEIEYADGTIIKKGLDLIIVDGVSYYIKGDKQPECFYDIISKSSLQ